MAPPRRKIRRPLGGGAKAGKKAPVKGKKDRDYSSSRCSSSGSYSSGSSSRDSDESSSGDSDEDRPSDYKKGGYHPVMPYQLYNGRYRVLSKLGAGAFSTVWLCVDEKDSSDVCAELVAMKVCKSKKSVTEQAEDEVALFDRLQGGSPHVAQMRNHFWHSGINGRHKCMVFEVMGENLLALVKYFDYKGLPVNMVRRLTRHTLLGLEYIHSRGVIHTDIKLENVLVHRHDFADLLQEAHRAHRAFTEQKKGTEGMSKSQKRRMKKKQKNDDAAEPAAAEEAEPEAKGEALSKNQKKKLKKKQANVEAKAADSDAECAGEKGEGDEESDDDRAAADACGRPVPPVRQKERFATLQANEVYAKLADFGNGTRSDNKVTDEIQTRQYRSPEVIFGAPWDETADLWSAACMFFELLTGDFLFDPSTGDDWSRDEDHLALITELLGDYPPKDWALSGKYSRDVFTSAGKFKHIKSMKFWDLKSVLESKYRFESDEAGDIAHFLLTMLQWQPKDRISATEALKHFWVTKAPGESDVPDPEKTKLNTSSDSTEADASETITSPGANEAPSPVDVASPREISEAKSQPGKKIEAPVAAPEPVEEVKPETSESTETAPVCAKVEDVKAEEKDIVVESGAVDFGALLDKKKTPAEKQEVVQEASKEESSPPEPAEADTTKDAKETPRPQTQNSKGGYPAPQLAAPVAAKPEGVLKADGSAEASLVAFFDHSASKDVSRLIAEAGSEVTKSLDDCHALVTMKVSGSAAVVAAAELARKVPKVKAWMSLEDYQSTHGPAFSAAAAKAADDQLVAELEGDTDRTKKKNKGKGKK